MKSGRLTGAIFRLAFPIIGIISFLVPVLAGVLPIAAGPPIQGTYSSIDLPGGLFDTGRFSESWVGGGVEGQVGNTLDLQSWDGSSLGGEWIIRCMSVDTPPLTYLDSRDENGTGEVYVRTEFDNGQLWLSRWGPWGDGSEDYFGEIWLFNVTTTHTYFEGVIQQITALMLASGPLSGWGNCVQIAIHERTLFGDSEDGGTKPADYPEFRDRYCSEGVWSRGSWGTISNIYLRIPDTFCAFLPIKRSTWGKIKSLYVE